MRTTFNYLPISTHSSPLATRSRSLAVTDVSLGILALPHAKNRQNPWLQETHELSTPGDGKPRNCKSPSPGIGVFSYIPIWGPFKTINRNHCGLFGFGGYSTKWRRNLGSALGSRLALAHVGLIGYACRAWDKGPQNSSLMLVARRLGRISGSMLLCPKGPRIQIIGY